MKQPANIPSMLNLNVKMWIIVQLGPIPNPKLNPSPIGPKLTLNLVSTPPPPPPTENF